MSLDWCQIANSLIEDAISPQKSTCGKQFPKPSWQLPPQSTLRKYADANTTRNISWHPLYPNSHQNSHLAKIKMAAILAAFHFADSIVFMAPEVGLEPTTLRLTALESAVPPATIRCYKLLSIIHLDPSPAFRIATCMCPIMTHFERAWVQKWGQYLRSQQRGEEPIRSLLCILETCHHISDPR